jgi:hypothetical protein
MPTSRLVGRIGLVLLAGATVGLGGCRVTEQQQQAVTLSRLPADPTAPLMLSKFPERWNTVYRAADDLKAAAGVIRTQLTQCGLKLDDPLFVAAMRRMAEAISATEAPSPSPAAVKAATIAALDAVAAAKAKCPSDLPPTDPFAKCLTAWQEAVRMCANDLLCLQSATISFLQCMGAWSPPTRDAMSPSSGTIQKVPMQPPPATPSF